MMSQHLVRPPEWIDSAPLVVKEQIVIDAPSATVWARIVDHRTWPEWFTDLDVVEPAPVSTGIGGGRTVTVKKLPIIEEFTAWDENQHFAFAVIESKIPILGSLAESVQLEALDGGRCRVTYRQGIGGRRGFNWLVTAIWKQAAKGLPRALENLKGIVESGS